MPPRPTGTSVEPWSAKTQQFEVAGEFYRMQSIHRLFQGIRTSSAEGAELRLPATLVPDPGNPHDRNAVAVYVRDLHVGYLERSDARVYHAAVASLAKEGQVLTVRSRQWLRESGSRTFARVTLSLPTPSGMRPANDIHPDAVVLPMGSTIQVTKEDEHMDALVPLVHPRGDDVSLAVSLHAIIDIRARSAAEAVQVRVDGAPVGLLSTTQSANLLPLVKFVEARNRVPVCRATLRGNSIKADVTLHVAKAQDLDPAWLAGLGPEVPRPQTATRPSFEWEDEPDTGAPSST